jgi:hypothetical protein
MQDPAVLRQLAAWYREFAVRAENPSARDARLEVVDALETAADRLERGDVAQRHPAFFGERRRAG